MSTLSQFLGGDSTPIGHLAHLGIADEPATATIGSQKWLRTGVLAPATSYPSVPTDYQRVDPGPVLHETLPQGETYNSIVHNGTIWVAVGDESALATSPDGVTWTKRTIPGGHYKSVIWTGTKFAACGSLTGNNGIVFATSTDGITWVHRVVSSGNNDAGRSIAWNGSIYVIVGGSSTNLRTSPDGVTWTTRTSSPSVSNATFTHIIWTGTKFAACGYDQNQTTYITSPDGITWTTVVVSGSSGYNASQICWNGSLFVVATNNNTAVLFTSPDGITWTLRNISVSYVIDGLVWTGSRFIGVGGSANSSSPILTSTDGINWSFNSFFKGASSYTQGAMTCLGISGSNILAIGGGADGFIARSSDGGINWTTRKPSAFFTTIAYNGSVYVAVSSDKICATSTDGINWTRRADFSNAVYDIVTSGSLFVAVGGTGSTGYIITSTDGINWTPRAAGPTNGALVKIVFGNGIFVSGTAAGYITTSTDGINWTQSRDSANISKSVLDISFANGIFFIVASAGLNSAASEYSYDGLTWRSIALILPNSASNLVWNGSLYMIVGSTMCRTSPDGINWTDRSSTFPSGLNIVFVVGGTFVACGVNKFATSTDGVNWVERIGAAASIIDTTTIGDKVYFVGANTIGSTTNTKYVGVPNYNKYQYVRVE